MKRLVWAFADRPLLWLFIHLHSRRLRRWSQRLAFWLANEKCRMPLQ